MISYTITASTEDKELHRLLRYITSKATSDNEIIIQLDSTTVTDEVRSIANNYMYPTASGKVHKVNVIEFPLNNDFAAFKNNLHQYCNQPWIFNIDADELPTSKLLGMLPSILESNPEIDAFRVPRWNTVDGITPEHIQRWGWQSDELGRINYPDYQWRIYKNNGKIKWINPVHEQLTGFETYAELPSDINDFSLFHNKTIERQEKQNQFYSTITK
jgi:hypothetical protein